MLLVMSESGDLDDRETCSERLAAERIIRHLEQRGTRSVAQAPEREEDA
jgi:hypothetical protein